MKSIFDKKGETMKIVAIAGSPRRNGNTNYLVDEALKEAGKHGIETEKIILNSLNMRPCQSHDDCASRTSCALQDDAEKVLNSFASADGIILSSPVYYYNVSAQMKIFIDRSIFLRRHKVEPKAKCVGLIAVGSSSGTDDAIDALKRFLASIGNLNPDEALVVAGHARGAGDVKTNEAVVNQARELGAEMARQLLGK
jgi:multimeric flavodoxin WrbA